MTPVTKLKTKQPQENATVKAVTMMNRVEAVVTKIATAKIETPADSVKLSGYLKDAAILKREIEADYKQKRAPLVRAQKDLIKEEKQFTALLEQAESAAAAMIKEFQRKEQEARAKKEAEERAKREAEAKQEAQLRADQLRAAAAAAPSKSVAKRLEAQATMVENAQPVIDPVPVEEAPQLLADGVHGRKNVHAAVDNLKRLVLQIAAGIMLKEYGGETDASIRAFLSVFQPNAQATMALIQPSMPKLNDLAKAFPKDLSLEGVRVEEDESFVSRA